MFETSLCHVAEKQVPGAIRELNRVMKTGLVFGSVTSDMAPALIDRYDLLRGVKKLGTWWEWSELFFGDEFDLSMHRRDVHGRAVGDDAGGGRGNRPVVCRLRQPALLVLRQGRGRRLRQNGRPSELFCRTHIDRIGSRPWGSPRPPRFDFAVKPAVQHRLVLWRPSLHRRTIRNLLLRVIRLRRNSMRSWPRTPGRPIAPADKPAKPTETGH